MDNQHGEQSGSQETLLGRLERIKKSNQDKINDIMAVQELFDKNPELLEALELIQKTKNPELLKALDLIQKIGF